MALGVSDVREVVERVCARPDVLDACCHRDLGIVVEVLGGCGVTQGADRRPDRHQPGSAERVHEAQAHAETLVDLREVR